MPGVGIDAAYPVRRSSLELLLRSSTGKLVAPAPCRDSKYANHFKIPAVSKALDSGHGVRFQLEWSPTPGKEPEMQIVTFAPPSYIGCASVYPGTWHVLCLRHANEVLAGCVRGHAACAFHSGAASSGIVHGMTRSHNFSAAHVAHALLGIHFTTSLPPSFNSVLAHAQVLHPARAGRLVDPVVQRHPADARHHARVHPLGR